MLDVFGLFKVDTLYVVIGLLVITIAAIVLAIVAICKACAMTKKYEIGCELKIKQLQKDKQQLFSSLELFYKVFYLEDY